MWLQNVLLNTRPGVTVATVASISLSVPACLFLLLIHCSIALNGLTPHFLKFLSRYAEKTKKVGMLGMFAHANGGEKIMMVLGLLGAFVNGDALPWYSLLFGKILNTIGDHDTSGLLDQVQKVGPQSTEHLLLFWLSFSSLFFYVIFGQSFLLHACLSNRCECHRDVLRDSFGLIK